MGSRCLTLAVQLRAVPSVKPQACGQPWKHVCECAAAGARQQQPPLLTTIPLVCRTEAAFQKAMVAGVLAHVLESLYAAVLCSRAGAGLQTTL
jgi:hypothetical protein